MMAEYAYALQNQIVWQKAVKLAVMVIKMSEKLPKTWAAEIIAKQIVRSSGSVCANIAEGYGRYSLAAQRHHFSIARGEAYETDSWAAVLLETGYITSATQTEIHAACVEVIKLLTSKMVDLEQQIAAAPKSKQTLKEAAELYEVEYRADD
jgi:four helix bundle protein